MNKLVKSVKKLTKKMTLTHLLVALLVVALVVAVVHSQSNQENFIFGNSIRRQQEAIAEAGRGAARAAQAAARAAQVAAEERVAAARIYALTKQYTRKDWKMPLWTPAKETNISMNNWIEKQVYYLQNQDNGKQTTNGKKTTKDSTWETKCAYQGKITAAGIAPVDLDDEEANLKAIGEPNVYKDLSFKKCQAICDFHSASETSKGQWEGGCAGFNITYNKNKYRRTPEAAECVFYSNKTVGFLPVKKWGFGLKQKLNTKMRYNWNTKAKVEQPKSEWWGLNARTAKWTYWPREELMECQ